MNNLAKHEWRDNYRGEELVDQDVMPFVIEINPRSEADMKVWRAWTQFLTSKDVPWVSFESPRSKKLEIWKVEE